MTFALFRHCEERFERRSHRASNQTTGLLRFARKDGKRVAAIFLGGLLSATSLHAEGATALEFLKIGTSPRALAMGGAATASGEDAAALHWNPAVIGALDHQELALSHARWFEQFRFQSLVYGRPLSRRWSGAVSAAHFSRADIAGYDDGGASTGQFDVSNLAAALTLGGDVGSWFNLDLDRVTVGFTAKYLREDLSVSKATAFAGDMGVRGVVYRRPGSLLLDRVQVGASLTNLGTPVKHDAEENSLPLTYRLGVAARGWARSLNLSADYEKPKSAAESLRFGVEHWVMNTLALRGGYRWALKDNQGTLQNGLHIGLGFQMGNLSVDYAYVPFLKVDDTHFLGLRLAWGSSSRLAAVEERIGEHNRAAQRAFVRKDFARADKELALVLTADPSHANARQLKEENQKQLATLRVDRQLALGRRLLATADYAEAQDTFQNILAIAPGHAEAKSLLAETQKLLDVQKVERRDALLRQGEEFLKEGNAAAAVDLLEKVLLLDPKNDAATTLLARAKERVAEQDRLAREAAERKRLEIGWAQLNQKAPNPAKARDVAKEVLKDNPDSDGAKLLLAQSQGRLAQSLVEEGRRHAQKNEHAKAYAALKQAVDYDPDNKIAQDLLEKTGDVLLKTGREEALNLYGQQKYKEALDKLNELAAIDPQAEDIARYRQEAIRKLGETRRVEAEILNKEGLKAYDDGNFREAIKYWKKALEIYPEHTNAKRNLERVQQQLKQ